MDRNMAIFEYLRTCPLLSDLWSIAATEEIGVKVVLPQGASPSKQYVDSVDVYGNYECEIVPYPSVYEDFQINCYDYYDTGDHSAPSVNVNALTLAEVENICKWIAEQDKERNFPDIGEKVVAIECNPFKPQIRYVNAEERTIGYYITIRVRYVNPDFERRVISYGNQD